MRRRDRIRWGLLLPLALLIFACVLGITGQWGEANFDLVMAFFLTYLENQR